MRRGIAVIVVGLIFFGFASACMFKTVPYKGIMSYRKGRVFLRKDLYYRVGILPPGWERMSTRVRTISFYNQELESSISTDAFCGQAIEGRRIDSMGGEIISGLDKRDVISEEKFDLDGRGAVRHLVEGELEGVKVMLDLVVVMKDGCVFDFYAVMPRHVRSDVNAAFEEFFGAFHYE